MAAAITPPGYEYFGLLYNPDDQNVHLAWARQAAQGHFFFRDLFTTEGLSGSQTPLFTNLFCWLLGVLSRVLHLPLIWVYHALRLLFTALALCWFYALCTHLTADKRIRLIALVLVSLSAGAGWLQSLLPNLFASRVFMDRPDGQLMMPEAFAFTSALIFPLNIASLALLAFIYAGVLQAQQTGQMRDAFAAGAAALVLTNIHTYDALPLNATLLVWMGLSGLKAGDKRVPCLAPLLVIACTLPPLLYQWIVFRNSEEFRIKALTPTLAPPIFDVLLSYGLLFLLAVIGTVALRREPRIRLMIVWATVTLLMIYAPVSFARKMIEGLHLPLCFLAATGLIWLVSRLQPQLVRGAIIGGVVTLSCVSSIYFAIWCVGNAADNNFSRIGVLMPPLYLTQGDAAALRYLAQAQPGKMNSRAVLCLRLLGNYVPRETGSTVYMGHWAETLDHERKLAESYRFYSGRMSQSEALAWLRANHIGYVIEGFYERLFAKELHWSLPAQRLPLKKLFDENGTAIYAVP